MSALALFMPDILLEPGYLCDLNPPQKQAVLSVDGPLLVLAGAGTGKTRVLTTRITHILHKKKARPFEILAVTFTNKAAQEMKERVTKTLGTHIEGMWIGTFHSIGVKILRIHSEKVGLTPHFSILDFDDQIKLIKQICQSLDIDDKRLPAKHVASAISRFKDQGKRPDQAIHPDPQMVRIYKAYQDRLQSLNAVDFGDLLLLILTLFKNYTDVLAHYQRQFKYILVDEYQDTNAAQYVWLQLLAAHHQNICCVGDDDQSIYGWRGAEVGNILRFDQDYPGCGVIRLEQNYRSTHHILGAASGLIENNGKRLSKTLWTERDDGEKILIKGTWDGEDEARFVIAQIEDMRVPLNQVAILVRASYQTRLFEERLLTTGIPYRVIGGLRFYERQEIKDALAYVKLIYQKSDSLAFERVINLPKRGIGPSTIGILHNISRERHVNIIEATRVFVSEDQGRPAVRKTLSHFLNNLDRWHSYLDTHTHSEVVKMVLDESGYTGLWMSEKTTESASRLENLKELIKAIEDFGHLSGFLDHVSLVLDHFDKHQQDQVTLMTLHGAKGLEFELVFLPGWEEGIFPHPRCLQENGLEGLEEERRLGYVGISRSKKHLIISYALKRYSFYQGWTHVDPSRFLNEIPQDHFIHKPAGTTCF
jgi:DNA helicase-2/ATP-dependent DNA helicase PcrA